MNEGDFGIEIISVSNGFLITDHEGNKIAVEEDPDDDVSLQEKLLWEIIDFFNFRNSRHSRERIAVVREMGDKYIKQGGEKIVKKYYLQIEKSGNKKQPIK